MAEPNPIADRRSTCASCGLELSPSAVACPSCHALIHAGELRGLAASAEESARQGRTDEAVLAYRRMLELLPRGTKQYDQIAQRIQAVQGGTPGDGQPKKKSLLPSSLAGLGGVGIVLWKLKGVLALVLGKGKFLLLGLSKASTLFTMLASFGLYWALWGWKLAAGIILSIYVHEMGHVAALKRLGIAASAPMFIPGLGAVVRLKQYPATPLEDAICGLAGPLWGLGAAVVAYAIGALGNVPVALAVAHLGAWINLFNLVPFASLDGGRGFRALSRSERWAVAFVMFLVCEVTGDSMLWLLVLVAAGRAAFGTPPEASSRKIAALYAFLIVALGALLLVRVPVP